MLLGVLRKLPAVSRTSLCSSLSLMPKSKQAIYAVAVGRKPGIYTSWAEAHEQTVKFPNNKNKAFKTLAEAEAYMEGHRAATNAKVGSTANGITVKSVIAALTPKKAKKNPLQKFAPYMVASPKKAKKAAGGVRANSTSVSPIPCHPTTGPKSAPPQDVVLQSNDGGIPKLYHVLAVEECMPSSIPGPLRLEFDGASKLNPGPSGLGAVLYDETTGVEVARVCHYMGYRTNNEAEYGGLIAGLQMARKLGCRKISIQGDSLLIINQIKGVWKVNSEHLKAYHDIATDLLKTFDSVEARQVPRAQNQVADALSNQAITEYHQGTSKGIWMLHSQQYI